MWQQRKEGVLYEVRSAGRTRRLYTDGVFHSQYNPGQILTGSVWDLLLLPSFLFPAEALKRVLVLGVGGGAVIHQLRHFFSDVHVTGVELSDVHLEVARTYFHLNDPSLELVCADARDWVAQYEGERFDLIIDDVFGEAGGEPARAIAADARWFDELTGLLSRKGALVMNFISRQELQASAFFHSKRHRNQFKSAFALTTEYYVNYVGAFLRTSATSQQLRKQVTARPELKKAYEQERLRYRIKRI